MDIKDSYLHGTVGVVKSISVDADILSYRLADVAGTTITVTMPTATQEANGLLSSDDKKKLDNMIATQVANDLILKINSGTIEDTSIYTYNGSSDKTLDIKEGSNVTLTAESNSLTIAASDTKVTQTNTTTSASYRVLFSESANNTTETATVRKSSKLLFNPNTGTLQTTLLRGNVLGTLYTERSVIPSTAGNLGSGTLGWFTASSSSGYAGDSTGFPVNSNANGILWLGTHGHNSDSTKIGYGHLLGFSSNGNIYHRSISNGSFPTTDNGSSWKQLAFTDSNITGNAASADKLKTARKLWGLDFDGTADVSGNMNGVGDINIPSSNADRYITFDTGSTRCWRLGYTGSGNGDANYLIFQSTKTASATNGWHDALKFGCETLNATFGGTVIAPTFQGNLDGTYVNQLTNYSKANSDSKTLDIVTTDSLNTALGKLEYKADFAYDWIISVTTEDTDEYINKWLEILDFLNGIDDTLGSNILDEFVTIKTTLDVTGKKIFINSDGTYFRYGNNGVRLVGSGDYSYLQLGLIVGDGTRTHKGKITGIGAQTLTSLDIVAHVSTFSGTVTATQFIKSEGKTSEFLKADGSVDTNKYLINTHATYTSAHYRTPNVNGTNYAFWSPINSSTAFTIYAPIASGDKGLVLISSGSGAPDWSDSVPSADKLKQTTIISAKAFSLSSLSWKDTGYTFANLSSGTYAVQITSGSNLVASGIMSVYKNLSDTIGDEIPLHVYGTASWRPYLRTYANKLLISSNDVDSKSRVVTIKIAKIL